jgi:hypothetical protein
VRPAAPAERLALLVTAVDAHSPASLSAAVVGGLLRGRLGGVPPLSWHTA